MRERIVLAFLSLILSACGPALTKNTNYDIDGNFNAEDEYNSISTFDIPVSIVGMIGSSITQRQNSTEFCRKTGAVVPNPVYTYTCWQYVSTGAQAQYTFNSISVGNQYQISIFTGSAIVESISGNTLCQQDTAVSPGATPSFYCYQKI